MQNITLFHTSRVHLNYNLQLMGMVVARTIFQTEKSHAISEEEMLEYTVIFSTISATKKFKGAN